MLNAGRGNPNWICTTPREAFGTLLRFGIEDARRGISIPDAKGRGPLVVLNDEIHYAHEAQKVNSTQLATKELRQHAEKNNLSIAQVIMVNEVAVSGKTEEQINAFLDKIAGAMLATVKSGLSIKEGVLPGPIKLQSKAATVWARAMDDQYEADRAIGMLSACALAASEENARGHLVITAPTGGSAGVMPAIVYGLVEGKRKLPMDKVREGLLAGAGIGYLCKHNATLSGAEGGCQSEIGVASAMTAAFIAQAMGGSPQPSKTPPSRRSNITSA